LAESATGGGAGDSAKYQYYETADRKYMLFCAIEAKFWKNWCAAAGREDLLGDHREDLVVDFGGGEDDLRREIQKTFHTKTLDEWMAIAIEHDIAMGPALGFGDIQDDPHLRARRQVVVEHNPLFGDTLTLGNPVVVPGREFTVRSAPAHGEHTDELLAELGYGEAARARLRADGVV
jgi:crotonobetainyl-CoA:carnitine CoA-transferase CaiB-like acyl-CoA transferase